MGELIHLQIEKGVGAGKNISLPPTGATVGRSSACQIYIQDQQMSRHHCKFFFQADKLWVRDMDSSNGTRINDVQVPEARVKPGDRITVGDTTLLVIYDDVKTPLMVRKESEAAGGQAAQTSPKRGGVPAWIRIPAWAALCAWFIFLLCSLVVHNPATHSARPEQTAAPASGPGNGGTVSEGPTATQAGQSGAQTESPAGSSTTRSVSPEEAADRVRYINRAVASCLAEDQYDRALAIIRREAGQPGCDTMRDSAAALERVIQAARAGESEVLNGLLRLSGQPVTFDAKGRRLTLIPRAIANDQITFALTPDPNSQHVSLNAHDLSAADRLRFLDPAKTVEQSILRCSLLLQIECLPEARETARTCGPLAEAFAELAGG
jgi:pSer/pThr/pTyr-binding forkhead associated (FHA) protein